MRMTKATILSALVVAIFVALGAADATAQVYWVQSADYGAGNQRQDVTNRVRQLASGPNFKVNNANMACDPAIGRDKTLRIVGQERGGRTRTFTYKEGATVNSQMFAGGSGGGGWGGPGGGSPGGGGYGLRIISASYGAGNNRMDVAGRLQSMIRNNRLSMKVNNETMGGDPSLGQYKNLMVTYEYQGQRRGKNTPEGGHLTLP